MCSLLPLPCQDGGRERSLTEGPQCARPLLADDLQGWGLGGPCPERGRKDSASGSATAVRPRELWAHGWRFITLKVASYLPSSPTARQATWAAPGAGMQGWPGPGLVTVSSSAWPRPGWGSEHSWLSGSCPPGRTRWADCRMAEVGMPGAGMVGSCPCWLSCGQAAATCPGALGMHSGPGLGTLLPSHLN